jgi:signal transduction histidine kinase
LYQFVYGLVVGVMLALPVADFIRKKKNHSRSAVTDTQKQLEELGKLTGGLAHEIKNPLSTIKVNLKLLSENIESSEDDSSARWRKKIEVLSKETDRLAEIMDDFLRYIGEIEPVFSAVNVNDLVSDLIDFYAPQASNCNVTIRAGLSDEPIICCVDPDMMRQVLLNLFINAQQAMHDGGELIIRTSANKGFAAVEVTDTGPGIEPEKLDNIFQAYYTSKSSGSGLGLSIARKIIAAHNGSINVNSQLGKGTSFTITLPEAE